MTSMNTTYVLLDRDGTIIFDKHYLANPDDVELLPGAIDGLRRLAELGCKLIVVTNQSGVARGYFDEPTLARIHERMRVLLAAEGIQLDALYYCPHSIDDACRCRKPQPGMAEQAAAAFGFDLNAAFVVGDRCTDLNLARAIGATSILVRTGVGVETENDAECIADFVANDLRDAAEFVAQKIG